MQGLLWGVGGIEGMKQSLIIVVLHYSAIGIAMDAYIQGHS